MARPSFAESLFRGPRLSGNAARTFRLHVAYALFDAAAGGVILNAPFIALKAMAAANWHMPLREFYSGVGTIAVLYLGSRMASRPKMPFVFIPGVAAAVCSLAMAAVSGNAFWFLTLAGVGAMFEIVTRPAVAAVLRANYPVEQRGHATGEVRSWSSLCFVLASLASAGMLQLASRPDVQTHPLWRWPAAHMPQLLMILAGLLSLAAFVCFRQIRVDETLVVEPRENKSRTGRSFRQAWAIVVHDVRFRRYLLGCFLDGFCWMLYTPLIAALLSRELGFGYLSCSVLMHAMPSLAAFAATGALGNLFDRVNPWISWAWVRFAYALDAMLLAATPLVALVFPPARLVMPVLGRLLRGTFQGGQWVLWWQLGITHFAPPGEPTSRYVGIMAFLNGVIRLGASATGMALAARGVSPQTLIVLGGLGVTASGVYSLYQAHGERRHRQPETMTEFERQFANAQQARADGTR